MAVTAQCSNHFKWALAKKMIDLSTDSVKVLLMRSGFVFSKDDHDKKINIKVAMGPAATIAFVDGGAGTDSITDSGNGFLTAGLVAGNKITISGSASNNIVVTAITVVAGTITVATGTLTTEGAGASVTLTSNNELATGFGYTQDSKTTGTITLAEDDTNDYLNATFPTVTWTASGGSIGPTPGAILYDDTSSDDTIIGYIDFGGEQTATDGNPFNLANGIIRVS